MKLDQLAEQNQAHQTRKNRINKSLIRKVRAAVQKLNNFDLQTCQIYESKFENFWQDCHQCIVQECVTKIAEADCRDDNDIKSSVDAASAHSLVMPYTESDPNVILMRELCDQLNNQTPHLKFVLDYSEGLKLKVINLDYPADSNFSHARKRRSADFGAEVCSEAEILCNGPKCANWVNLQNKQQITCHDENAPLSLTAIPAELTHSSDQDSEFWYVSANSNNPVQLGTLDVGEQIMLTVKILKNEENQSPSLKIAIPEPEIVEAQEANEPYYGGFFFDYEPLNDFKRKKRAACDQKSFPESCHALSLSNNCDSCQNILAENCPDYLEFKNSLAYMLESYQKLAFNLDSLTDANNSIINFYNVVDHQHLVIQQAVYDREMGKITLGIGMGGESWAERFYVEAENLPEEMDYEKFGEMISDALVQGK